MSRHWRILIHTAPLAVILAWIIIGLSWYLNGEWFVFTENAYSDFGGSMSCCPQLYNYGLIIVGIILSLYGLSITGLASNKIEVAGGSYIVMAGIFLALIGIFPSGTRPHTFVSTWFFIQADVALIITELGLWRRLHTPASFAGLAASIAAFPVAIIVGVVFGWPSAAVIETYGIIVIDIVSLLVYLDYVETLLLHRGNIR